MSIMGFNDSGVIPEPITPDTKEHSFDNSGICKDCGSTTVFKPCISTPDTNSDSPFKSPFKSTRTITSNYKESKLTAKIYAPERMTDTTSKELDKLLHRIWMFNDPTHPEAKQAIEAYVAQRVKALLDTISKHLPEKLVDIVKTDNVNEAMQYMDGWNDHHDEVNKLLTTNNQKGKSNAKS